MRNGLQIIATLAAVGAAAAVRADPYWIAYEGNDFPENEGWMRNFSAGGANRYIEDGSLVIDSLSSTAIYDAYQWFGITNPDSGELFVAEWRENMNVWFDNGVGVVRDGVAGDLIEEDPEIQSFWSDVQEILME